MATTTTTMPARGHLTALKFDPTQPRELCRYFDELDMLFTACSITDSDQMKRHACHYLDIDSAELWESVSKFTTGVSFNTFRTAIHKLYPGSENDRKWSISDMDKLVGEQLRIGIFDVSDLGMYYRSFYNITQFLHTKNRISEAELSFEASNQAYGRVSNDNSSLNFRITTLTTLTTSKKSTRQ